MLTAFLRGRIAAEGMDKQIVVASAGLFAQEGDPVDPIVLELLESRGLPLMERTSRPVRIEDLRQAHLILAATEQHRLSVFHRSSESLYKVVLLSELVGEHRDLADPSGLPPAHYQHTLAEIQRYVDGGWQRLCRLLAL